MFILIFFASTIDRSRLIGAQITQHYGADNILYIRVSLNQQLFGTKKSIAGFSIAQQVVTAYPHTGTDPLLL